MVELLGDIAGQFQVLTLVFTDRYMGCLVDQDIGGLQHGVGIETHRSALLVLAGLVLELSHTIEPAEAGDTVQQPGQFAVGAHGRLREYGRFLDIDAGGQVTGGDLAGLAEELGRFLPDGNGVQIGDHIETLGVIHLHIGEFLQRTEIVAEVQ